MSTRVHTAPRRALRGGILASLVAVAGLLAGCSSGSTSNAEPQVDLGYGGAPAPAQAAGRESTADAAMTSTVDSTKTSAADRSVIITGSMYMTVKDPIAVADRAAGIVENAGGRIDARNETAPVDDKGGSASLTLRIPSSRLDAVVASLRELGTVDQFSTDSYDVSTQVTDLDAQISTLRASTKRIEGLLADAKDISDIITLENELDSRQAQLQSLEAQQRGLDDQVSMSTISLSLTTEPVVIVAVDDSPKSFWDGLQSSWDSLVAFLAGTLVVVGVVLPWLALIGLVAFALLAATRARKSRAARGADASAPAPVVPKEPAPKQAAPKPSRSAPKRF